MTVLLIDDEIINRMILRKYLNKNKVYHIIEASDGEEGFSLFKENENHLDLIITDYQMPNMNGAELTKKIKLEEESEIPIFLQTAYDYEYTHENLKLEDEFLRKPININIFTILLERYME